MGKFWILLARILLGIWGDSTDRGSEAPEEPWMDRIPDRFYGSQHGPSHGERWHDLKEAVERKLWFAEVPLSVADLCAALSFPLQGKWVIQGVIDGFLDTSPWPWVKVEDVEDADGVDFYVLTDEGRQALAPPI